MAFLVPPSTDPGPRARAPFQATELHGGDDPPGLHVRGYGPMLCAACDADAEYCLGRGVSPLPSPVPGCIGGAPFLVGSHNQTQCGCPAAHALDADAGRCRPCAALEGCAGGVRERFQCAVPCKLDELCLCAAEEVQSIRLHRATPGFEQVVVIHARPVQAYAGMARPRVSLPVLLRCVAPGRDDYGTGRALRLEATRQDESGLLLFFDGENSALTWVIESAAYTGEQPHLALSLIHI